MTQPDDSLPDPAWDQGTWEGLERAQLQSWAKIPFPQKLEWLEQAHQLSLRFQAHRQGKNAGQNRSEPKPD